MGLTERVDVVLGAFEKLIEAVGELLLLGVGEEEGQREGEEEMEEVMEVGPVLEGVEEVV